MPSNRPRAWADININDTILASDGLMSPPLDLLANAPSSDTITAVRLIGFIQVLPQDASLNVQAQQRVTVGIGVTSLEAFTAAVLPDPGVDNEFPPRGWLYKATRVLAFQNSSTFGVEDYVYPSFNFDVRAARRIDKGVLFLAIQNRDIFGTPMIVRVTGLIRALCLT